jgi:hypothetical protein
MNQHPHSLRGGVKPPSNNEQALHLQQVGHLEANNRIKTLLMQAAQIGSGRLSDALKRHIAAIDAISQEITQQVPDRPLVGYRN